MANKVLFNTETATLWGSEVGDDLALSSESISDGSGRQGANLDLSAAPRSIRYLAEGFGQAVATPSINGFIGWHAKTSGSETATPDHPTNDDGSGDIAVSATDKLKNCPRFLTTLVDEAAANIEYSAKTVIEIVARHFAPIMQVEMGAATTSDDSETKFRLTPMPDEIQ